MSRQPRAFMNLERCPTFVVAITTSSEAMPEARTSRPDHGRQKRAWHQRGPGDRGGAGHEKAQERGRRSHGVEQRAEVGQRPRANGRLRDEARGSRRVRCRTTGLSSSRPGDGRRFGGDAEMGQDRHDGLALRTLTDVGDDPPAPTARTREHILQVDAADEGSPIDARRR
jgi:hypothetical protein